MPSPLRIVVADYQQDMQAFYRTMLPKMGHQVVAAVETGKALIEQCLTLKPDLLITNFRLLDMDAVEAVEEVYRERRVPVIVLTPETQQPQIRRAVRDRATAYLLKPAGKAELEAEIPLAIRHFQELEVLRRDVDV